MTADLYLVPSIQTAQRHLLEQIRRLKISDPAARVTILLPNPESKSQLQFRLGDSINVSLVRFPDLCRTFLHRGGVHVRPVNYLIIERLVRTLFKDMDRQGELTSFQKIYDKPGFSVAVIKWMREMKSQNIAPSEVEEEAGRSSRERDSQLAIIYGRYQRYLIERNLVDDGELLWRASAMLEEKPELATAMAPLFVLAFDRFSPAQLRLLELTACSSPVVTVYQMWNDSLPEEGLALARLVESRRLLEAALAPSITHLDDDLPDPGFLKPIRDSLFEVPPSEKRVSNLDLGETPAIRAVAAPSREAEVRWTLREIKKLLISGVSPRAIYTYAPRPEAYKTLIAAVADEYGLVVDVSAPLETNPAVSALINLLQVAPSFPWRETFQALRSPYFENPWLTDEQVNLLEKLTRERPVVDGQNQWFFALQPLKLADDYRGRLSERLVAKLPPEELALLENGLRSFFDLLSPNIKASYGEHSRWFQEEILGVWPETGDHHSPVEERSPSLKMKERIEGQFELRDLPVLEQVIAALRQLNIAADLVPAGVDRSVTRNIFRQEVIEAIRSRITNVDPGTAAIPFFDLRSAASLTADYIFILGLAEGEFPRPPGSDPIYAAVDRAQSQLPLKLDDPTEDASLWLQVISNCERSLSLLRPKMDEKGVPWLPSPYWKAVIEAWPNISVETLALDKMPEIEDSASSSELMLALADQRAQIVPAELEELWSAVNRASSMMSVRQSWRPPGVFEGVFVSPDITAEFSSDYGPGHVWSPSRLNRYGSCPYGFFAEQILQIQSQLDPEEGFDPMQRGSLLHAILEDLFKELASENVVPAPPNQEIVLGKLEIISSRHFRSAPQRYQFRSSPLWEYEQQEVVRILRAFVLWDMESNNQDAQYQAAYQELFFGFRSAPGALMVEDEDGLQFKVHGVIDRVDLSEDGQAVVIDYKSGAGKFYKSDIELGLAFQTPLYALAVDRLVPGVSQVEESKYLHIPSRIDSGKLKFSGPVDDDETVRTAVNQAGAFVHNIRRGYFPSAPGKPGAGGRACRNYCDLASLCRVSGLTIAKAKRLRD